MATVRQTAGPGDFRVQRALTDLDVDGSGGDTHRTEPVSSSARVDVADDLIAVLEERILAQLERRGGRFQGVW